MPLHRPVHREVPARRFTFCSAACVHEWKLRTDPGYLRDQVFARLRRFWYDTALSPAAQTMEVLAGVAAPEQIVFGSDWPFANAGVIAEAVKTYEAVTSISPEQRAAVDRSNALSLFPQFA